MARELPKQYDPSLVEGQIYEMWMQNDCFRAEPDPSKKPYSIVMPPPNVTGQLHMGHALDSTLQDILTRYKRMQGYSALWLPGTDHAGIATQIKVEEELRKNEGLTRYDLGREKFLERVWAWKEKYGSRIVQQQKKLGVSCDWSRSRFTMDEGCSKAVREAFCTLYDKGLIYKGSRIINWCPHCVTALSDAEVEYRTSRAISGISVIPWQGRLRAISDGRHDPPGDDDGRYRRGREPGDERYKASRRQDVHPADHEPGNPDRRGRVCARSSFGTGAVKMTPAHDPNDFEVGLRHHLESIRVMDDDGRVNENGGKYQGMDRYECRKAIVAGSRKRAAISSRSSLTPTMSAPATAATPRRADGLQAVVRQDGAAGKARHRGVEERRDQVRARALHQESISTGWRTSATGASPVSCGGATRSRPGTATTAARSPSPSEDPHQACPKSAAART
jgi:valyl-tRNA synthetase